MAESTASDDSGSERFRALFEYAPVGVALCSLDGRFQETNDALRGLLVGTGIDPDTGNLDDLLRCSPEDSVEAQQWRSELTDLVAGSVAVVRAEFPVRSRVGAAPEPGEEPVTDRWLAATAVRVDLGSLPFVLVHLEDVTSRHREQQHLRRLAWHDPVTGLANRTLTGERLAAALDRFRDGGQRVGVLYLDIDDFKVVNDRFGHAAGDRVLVTVADRLRTALRATDTAGRLGGDEFCVVADVPDEAALAEVVRRVRVALRPAVRFDTEDFPLRVSVGAALSAPGDTVNTLIARADEAMYRDKQGRRGARSGAGAVTDLRRTESPGADPLPVSSETTGVH